MKKHILLLGALLLSAAYAADSSSSGNTSGSSSGNTSASDSPAQDNNEQNDIKAPKVALWRLEMGPSTKIILTVPSITGVAMHPFLLNGENQVTEVTVDTTGNNTIRFYYIHQTQDLRNVNITDHKQLMSAAKQRLNREATTQKDTNALPSVKFPEGTYAHSIEYQVKSLEDLEKIYKSIISVWERNSKIITNLNLK